MEKEKNCRFCVKTSDDGEIAVRRTDKGEFARPCLSGANHVDVGAEASF